MSAGNAAAQVGSATPATKKIPSVGIFAQDTDVPGPSADGPYIGINAVTYWNYNFLGEDPGFLVPSNSGVLGTSNVGPDKVTGLPDVGTPNGKTAQWVTSGASAVTVPADGKLTYGSQQDLYSSNYGHPGWGILLGILALIC